jgi:hypothetical protein
VSAVLVKEKTSMTQPTNSSGGTATQPSPAQQQTVQLGTPDLYQLHGDGISVTYHPVFVGGLPALTYQDAQRTLSFRGNEIRRVDVPDLGTIVSVTLVMTVDTGSTTFSLLVPPVNLPNHTGASTHISTVGITTVHRRSPVPAANLGQRAVYTVTHLHGSASLVIIPL